MADRDEGGRGRRESDQAVSSLRSKVHAIAAADVGPGGFVTLLTDGLGGLLGGDGAPVPSPPPRPLWAVLTFWYETSSFAPNSRDGVIRWWLYDAPVFGYTRLRRAGTRLGYLYPEQTGGLYQDDETREIIWRQEAAVFGPETVAPEYGALLLWVDVPYRKTHPGITRMAS